MNLPFFQKILTHFRIDYHVLHDMDDKLSTNGNKSPAWSLNERIWEGILASRDVGVAASRYVFQTEFESANGYSIDETVGKPFSAYREAAKWSLDDESKAAIRFVRHIVSGKALEPEFTQDALENLAQ